MALFVCLFCFETTPGITQWLRLACFMGDHGVLPVSHTKHELSPLPTGGTFEREKMCFTINTKIAETGTPGHVVTLQIIVFSLHTIKKTLKSQNFALNIYHLRARIHSFSVFTCQMG